MADFNTHVQCHVWNNPWTNSPVLVSFLFGSILEHQSNTSVLEYSATRVLEFWGGQSQDNPGTASVTEWWRPRLNIIPLDNPQF